METRHLRSHCSTNSCTALCLATIGKRKQKAAISGSPMNHDYDDSDWTAEEMLALAARAFDDADSAGPIPEGPTASPDHLEDFILSRSQKFQEILHRSEESLNREGGITSDEMRRRLGL